MTTADIVNSWFSEKLAGGPLAQSTAAYNQAREALPVLIERLETAATAPAKKSKSNAAQPAAALSDPA